VHPTLKVKAAVTGSWLIWVTWLFTWWCLLPGSSTIWSASGVMLRISVLRAAS